MLFKLSNPNSNLTLTPGYLNPALNNLAQLCIQNPGREKYCHMGYIGMCRRGSCPFLKRSLPFTRHLNFFWPIIESVSIKKKQNRHTGSNPDLSYPYLSPLPLHYNTDPPEVRKILSNKLTNYFLSLIGDRKVNLGFDVVLSKTIQKRIICLIVTLPTV